MGRLRSGFLGVMVAIIFLSAFVACGGRRPPGQSPYPARITLSPSGETSVQLGSTFALTATAQNSANSNISTTFTYMSSDTSILNISPNGIACAGVWDATYGTCSGSGIGVVQVTASAVGATSAPTYIFVHPTIDHIDVAGVLLDGLPIQEPCLPQSKTMTVQATAYSQGTDVTSSVGPFTWTLSNPAVATITPLVPSSSNYNFATNQATVAAVNPGLTYVYASASGVSSTSFVQPNLDSTKTGAGATFPGFNFFETCPIQNIVLEMNEAGSEQTSFSLAKGAAGQSVVATVTDVLGNTSLVNLTQNVTLTKVPLTWTPSQPGVINTASACTQFCGLTIASPGSGSVTASCSPPTCNMGFPIVPAMLTAANATTCVPYLQQFFPQITSCEAFIPKPVFSSPLATSNYCGNYNGHTGQPACPPAISGLITGTPGTTSILASSFGCATTQPALCGVGAYDFATGKNVAGAVNSIPNPPNSMLYDLGGDKIYMGSNFGAEIINPSNFGTSTSAFSPIGTITGNVLAVSANGDLAVFSDTVHVPNQVFVVNETNSTNPGFTPLTITGATAAAFSPDSQKAFIFGYDTNNLPNLYVYSTVQGLQTIPLALGTTVNAITFSTNGAFVYLAEPSLGGAGPAVSVVNNCDNSPAPNGGTGNSFFLLTAAPIAFKAMPDGLHFIALEVGGVIDYISAAQTNAVPAATIAKPASFLCSTTTGTTPYALTVSNTVQNIGLNQGNIHPINFFVSADGTLIYVVASDLNSIVIYDLLANAVTGGIQLASTLGGVDPTPVMADVSVDDGTIAVAASDGYVHQISTLNGGADLFQTQFPNLPNYLNSFCTYTPGTPCTLNFVTVKP